MIGVSATGVQRKWLLIFRERNDLGTKMKEQLLDDIAQTVLINSDKTVFVDPTPWMESIRFSSDEMKIAK